MEFPADVVLSEIIKRKSENFRVDDFCFKPQAEFVNDRARFVAALCTRRAGKSNGLAYKFYRAGMKHPGVLIPYFALTRSSAKDIMWSVLLETAEALKVPIEPTESTLSVRLPNNSVIRLYGADMKNFIRRIRGIKTPCAGVDEAGEFGPHLEQLIDDILTPATADYADGQIALTGTPGPIPFGYFYDVTELGKFGFSTHKWSVYDNPHMPDPKQFVQDLKKRKGWTDTSPTFLREWCGRWVKDLDSLVFKYDPERNHFNTLPEARGTWEFVLGVDIGFKDADAIAVIGWNETIREAYLVEEVVTDKQDISALASQIDHLIRKYDPLKIVMDTGGLGRKIAEELRRRFSLPIEAAEKTRKFEFIEILNDAFRSKRFFAKSTSRFAADAMRVQWDKDKLRPDKLVVSDKFHSDICDAVLYAFRECLSWLFEPEPDVPGYQTPEWYQREEDEMLRAAEKALEPPDDDPWRDVG